MKKIILSIFAMTICICSNAQPQPELCDLNLGLVYHLVEIKTLAENHLAGLFENKTDVSRYLELKLRVDQFVIQLSGDLKDRNSLKAYRDVDCYYKGEQQKIENKNYSALLVKIDNAYKTFMKIDTPKNHKLDVTLSGDPVSDLVSIITSARDFTAKKIDDLVKLMDGLRLSSISDIKKGASNNDDNKKEEKK